MGLPCRGEMFGSAELPGLRPAHGTEVLSLMRWKTLSGNRYWFR